MANKEKKIATIPYTRENDSRLVRYCLRALYRMSKTMNTVQFILAMLGTLFITIALLAIDVRLFVVGFAVVTIIFIIPALVGVAIRDKRIDEERKS